MAAIAVIAVACMAVGGWLWNHPSPGTSEDALSRQPPKHKILAGVAGVFLWLAISVGESNHIETQFLAMALVAYGLVGALELVIDRHYPTLKTDWDAMGAWKKILISTAVIVVSFVVFSSLMRYVAIWLMSR